MADDALIGTTFGRRYRIDELIGRGATGRVYAAEDTRIGRPVALKVLNWELARDEQLRARFIREPRYAAGIRHPNIIPVTDAGEDDGQLYIVMNLIEGEDLQSILQAPEPLEPQRAINILTQAAAGLDAAHAAGRIHRDVKPANILVGPGDVVFLTDFGMARTTEAGVDMTAPGRFLGTVAYAAPEQFTGGTTDALTDIYSFGCLTYECLSGRLPFERDSDFKVAQAHVNGVPPPISTIRPELAAALDAVFERALAKEPANRFTTTTALVEATRAALGDLVGDSPRGPGTPVPGTTDPAAHTFSRRRRAPARLRSPIAAITLVALAAAAGVGLALAASTGGKAPSPPQGRAHLFRSTAVRVLAPPGWVKRTPPAGTRSSRLFSPVEVAPDISSPNAILVAGSDRGRGAADPLPPEIARANPAAKPTRLKLGSIEGLRYEDITLPGVAGRAVLYALPTSRRIVYVACLTEDSGSTAFLTSCERVASTARPVAGYPISMLSTAKYARRVERIMGTLRELVPSARTRLLHAKSRTAQVREASASATAYRHAYTALRKVKPGRPTAGLQGALERWVDKTSRDYESLARAARDGNGSAWKLAARRLVGNEATIPVAANDLLAAILVAPA